MDTKEVDTSLVTINSFVSTIILSISCSCKLLISSLHALLKVVLATLLIATVVFSTLSMFLLTLSSFRHVL